MELIIVVGACLILISVVCFGAWLAIRDLIEWYWDWQAKKDKGPPRERPEPRSRRYVHGEFNTLLRPGLRRDFQEADLKFIKEVLEKEEENDE